jgi:ketosteroid isomerase-like protein
MGTTRQNTDEAQIRRLVAAWAEAVERHDLAGVVAHHSVDVRMFDVTAPPQLRRFEVSELEVAGGADVAFCHGIIHCAGASSISDLTIRLTIGLLKLDGQWSVVHEHHSEAQPT